MDGYSLQPSLFDEASFFCEVISRAHFLVLHFLASHG